MSLVAACGGDDDDDGADSTAAPSTEATEPTEPTEPTTAPPSTDDESTTPTTGDTESTTPTGGPTDAEPPAALVDAANAEGSLTMYGNFVQETGDELVAAFREKYPEIDAQWVKVNGGDGFAKFMAEAESGAAVADVYANPSLDYMTEAHDKGAIAELSETDIPNLAGVADDVRADYATAVYGGVFGICYNTDRVDEADVPKSWGDAGAEAFKGETLIPDPEQSDLYINVWEAIRREFGDDLLKGIGANSRIVAGGSPASQAIAAGEGELLVMCVADSVGALIDQGAPVEFYVPEGAKFGSQTYAAVANGPHPNAGALFVNFLLSPEAAAIFSSSPPAFGITERPDGWQPALNVATEVKPNILALLKGQ